MIKKKKDKTTKIYNQYIDDVLSNKIQTGRLVKLACKRHLEDLKTGKARGIYFDEDEADRVIRFFNLVRFYEGAFAGQRFVLQPWQAFIVAMIFGWKNKDGSRRFLTAYVEIGKGSGKALSIDTLIATPSGWTTMEKLKVGDQIFGLNGNPVNVVYATDIMYNHDCYLLKFSDGAEIIADAEHLWFVRSLRNGKKKGVRKDTDRKGGYFLRTTEELSKTAFVPVTNSKHPQAKYNHNIPIASPLELPEIKLPIPAYTLGIWLGDGDSDCARITCFPQNQEIFKYIKDEGIKFVINANNRFNLSDGNRNITRKEREQTINAKLRKYNLLNNKHIPEQYFRASFSQRLSLLQGLMDTDGYIDKLGRCEITLCNYKLICDVQKLLYTLGYKCKINESNAKLNGRITGKRWRLLFQAYKDIPVFKFSHKKKRLKERPKTKPLSLGRMLISCEKIQSVPVKCIAVDSKDNLFLAGEKLIPTHNTPMAAVIGLYGLVADGESGAEIYSAAVTREQAGITFRDAKNMAESSPSLAKRLLISANNIAYLAKQSFFRAVSSEHRGLDGKRPYIALIDEVHEHQTGMVIDKMRAGTKGRRSPLIFEITNSGYDKNSVCWHHHDYSQKILECILDNDSWFAYVCGLDVCQKCADEGKTMITDDCPDCDDWRDKKVWLKANPNLGISIKEKYLEQQVQEAIDMPSKQNIVKRLNFCIWTESETRWIGSDKWDACASAYTEESLNGKVCYGGLDLSSIGDLTAFALIFPPMLEGEKYRILCRFWLPEEKIIERSRKDKIPYDMWVRQGHIMVTPGNAIDYAFVIKTIQDDAKKFELGSIAFDRWGSTKIIQDLHNLGFEDPSETKNATRTLIDFGQGFASMSSPTKELEKMILKKEIEHPNNPVLNWMLSNAIITYDPAGNIKVDKSRSTEKVDGVIAVIMGLDLALRNQTEGEPSITIL